MASNMDTIGTFEMAKALSKVPFHLCTINTYFVTAISNHCRDEL